jgi:hypothetical protein
MGQIQNQVAAYIEVFLRDALRLEGRSEDDVGQRTRFLVLEYEGMFRAFQEAQRDKDLAARVCRALCRNRIIKEIAGRRGTPAAEHLKLVLDAIAPPGFSSKDR